MSDATFVPIRLNASSGDTLGFTSVNKGPINLQCNGYDTSNCANPALNPTIPYVCENACNNVGLGAATYDCWNPTWGDSLIDPTVTTNYHTVQRSTLTGGSLPCYVIEPYRVRTLSPSTQASLWISDVGAPLGPIRKLNVPAIVVQPLGVFFEWALIYQRTYSDGGSFCTVPATAACMHAPFGTATGKGGASCGTALQQVANLTFNFLSGASFNYNVMPGVDIMEISASSTDFLRMLTPNSNGDNVDVPYTVTSPATLAQANWGSCQAGSGALPDPCVGVRRTTVMPIVFPDPYRTETLTSIVIEDITNDGGQGLHCKGSARVAKTRLAVFSIGAFSNCPSS
jgi:hypothetical protein